MYESSQIAKIQQQLVHILESISDVKKTLNTLTTIEKTVSELQIHTVSHKSEIEILRGYIDKTKETTVLTNEKVNGILDKAKGAMWVFGTCFGIFQSIIIISLVWAVTSIFDATLVNKLQQQRIEVIESLFKNNFKYIGDK